MKTLLKVVIDKDIEDPMYDLVLQPGFDTDYILTLYVGPNTNIEEALNNKESINKKIDDIKSLFNDNKDFDLSELNHKSLIDNIEFVHIFANELCMDDYNNIFYADFEDDYSDEEKEQIVDDFIKNNPSLKKYNIVIYEYINSIEVIDKIKNKYKEFKGVYIHSSEGLVSIDYFSNMNIYDNLVKDIKKLNLSPLENAILVYDLVKEKEYKEEDKGNLYSESRDKYKALEGDRIVCAGYSEIFSEIMNRLDIRCRMEMLDSNNLEAGHARNIVYLKDDKYGIDGNYIVDATVDNKSNTPDYLYSFICFMKTFDVIHQLDKKSGYKEDTLSYLEEDNQELIEYLTNVDPEVLNNPPKLHELLIGYCEEKGIPEKEAIHMLHIHKPLRRLFSDKLYYNINPLTPFKEAADQIRESFNRPIYISTFIKALMHVKYIENKINPDKYKYDPETIYNNLKNYRFAVDKDYLYERSFTPEERLMSAIFGETPKKEKDYKAYGEGLINIMHEKDYELKKQDKLEPIKVTGTFKLYKDPKKNENN